LGKLIDFDAFRAEQQDEPVVLRIGGREYNLPPSMPAAVAVDTIRLQETMKTTDDVPVTVLDKMGKAIFGAAIWEELLAEHRLNIAEIPELIKMAFAAYSPGGGEGKADPQAASTQPTKRRRSRS
jgi:hypothetical protein